MLGAILSKLGIATTRLTAARATKLENNCNASAVLIAEESIAVSNANMTTARIIKMDRLIHPVLPKTQVGGIVTIDKGGTTSPNGNIMAGFNCGYPVLTADYQLGFRVVPVLADASYVLVDALNVSAPGYLLACCLSNIGGAQSCQITLTLDGILIADSTYASLAQYYQRLVYGTFHGESLLFYPCMNRIPLRFDTSIRVQHRASSTNIKTSIVYLLD